MWWRVYYADGSVFTSQEGEPWDAPRLGVQVVAQERDGDHELVWGRDHFYYDPGAGGWCTTDLFGALTHLATAPRQCLLFGQWMADDRFARLMERVHADIGPRTHRGYPREPKYGR